MVALPDWSDCPTARPPSLWTTVSIGRLRSFHTCVTPLNLHSRRYLGHSWGISLGARLRWAVRAEDEPTATERGDPSGTYKRWFGRVSGRAGWWRGSSLVGTSYWPGGHRGMRAGSCHARDRVQRMDAPMQLLCG